MGCVLSKKSARGVQTSTMLFESKKCISYSSKLNDAIRVKKVRLEFETRYPYAGGGI